MKKQLPEVIYGKGVLKNFSMFTGIPCVGFFFSNKVAGLHFIKTETPTQVLSCEFCGIFKNTFFTEHLQATAFGYTWKSREEWVI